MIKKPIVSILCTTYNHEDYIEDAIKGFLMQKTNFEFEILIHDDASSDNTPQILKEYENRYPNIIKVIYQKENKFSQGIKPLWEFLCPMALGDYIAFCEGDDYWIDSYKLQKQVDLLYKEPMFNLSFHSSNKVSYDIKKDNIIGQYHSCSIKIPFEDIFFRTRGMIPTASCVITKSAMNKIKNFMLYNKYLVQGDIYIQYISSFNYGALYINEPMSVYRYRTNESWTKKYSIDSEFKTKVLLSKLKSFVNLKIFLNLNDTNIVFLIFFNYLFQLRDHLFNINSKYFKDIDSVCEEIVREGIINHYNIPNKPIIIYGAGSKTEWLINKFKNILNIKYILDSDSSKNNSLFCGYLVKHISSIKVENPILFSLFGKEYEITQIYLNNINPSINKILYIKEQDIELLYNKIQKIL